MTDDKAPLQSVEARYQDLLSLLGVNGHDGARAEIKGLRLKAGLDEPDATLQDEPYAFNYALAGESIPDELSERMYSEQGTFDSRLNRLLVKFATTVAYKVYHNLRNGYSMDMTKDPLEYVDCGNPRVGLTHEEFENAIQGAIESKGQ